MGAVVKRKPVVLIVLALSSAVLGTYEISLGLQGFEGSVPLHRAWGIAFGALVAMWARDDAAARRTGQAFDFGFYIMFLWPVVLPYHMVKTRGLIGLGGFLGLAALYFAPLFLGFVACAHFSPV